jgi:ParB-like chromosome segregation protein Spo0J
MADTALTLTVRVPVRVAAPPRVATREPAQVARMLALAHHVEAGLASGRLVDQATVARVLGFTRARLTHLLDLTLLAPPIQDAVLALEAVDGVEPVAEHALRAVCRARTWREQWARWQRLRPDARSQRVPL